MIKKNDTNNTNSRAADKVQIKIVGGVVDRVETLKAVFAVTTEVVVILVVPLKWYYSKT